MPKISFIGAGDVVFTYNLLGDIFLFPELAESEIALMDIDAERLRIAEMMAHKVAEQLGAHPTIKAYQDRKEAWRVQTTPSILFKWEGTPLR